MKKLLTLLTVTLLTTITAYGQVDPVIITSLKTVSTDNQTTVLVLGAIHGAHKRNQNYSYEQLFGIIDSFKPDIIGIEIRPEDLNEPSEYLKKNYPPDMIKIKERYSGQKIIIGFDWLAEILEGKLIPENYWKEISVIKKMETEFDKDSTALILNIKNATKLCNTLQMELVLNGSAVELNTKYDSLASSFYDKFKTLTNGTKYEELSKFYTRRDKYIDENIVEVIKMNKGKRIIFVMGVDHKVFALAAIKKKIGNKVEIIDLKNVITPVGIY